MKKVFLIALVLLLLFAICGCGLTVQGKQGIQGIQGVAGAQGIQGVQGAQGTAGYTWYSGEGVPSPSLGIDGDYYLRTSNCDVYLKSGTWNIVANLKGSQGEQGEMGVDGENGANGYTWYSGSGSPDVETGVNGDYYLETSNSSIFNKVSGSWNFLSCILGATGAVGQTGATGEQGMGLKKIAMSSVRYGLPGWTWFGAGNRQITNTAYVFYIPICVTENTTYTGMSIWLISGNSAGKTLKARIYSWGTDNMPGVQIGNEVSFSLATTGVKNDTNNFTLAKGYYFVGWVVDVACYLGAPSTGYSPLMPVSGYSTATDWVPVNTIEYCFGGLTDPATKTNMAMANYTYAVIQFKEG